MLFKKYELLILVFLIVVLRILLLKPIQILNNVVNEVGGGNLAAEIDLERNDELGGLARSFKKMIINLAVE